MGQGTPRSRIPVMPNNKHVVEACVMDGRYNRGRTRVINYERIEVEVADHMETHAYMPAEIRPREKDDRLAEWELSGDVSYRLLLKRKLPRVC